MMLILKSIRRYVNAIIISFCAILSIPMILNYKKITLILNEEITFLDLVTNRLFVVLILFWLGTVLMAIVHMLNIYKFRIEQVKEYKRWWFSSCLSIICYDLYRVVLPIHHNLSWGNFKDILFQNNFFIISRVWGEEELKKIISLEASKLGVEELSIYEVSGILNVSSVEETINQTRLLCQEKLSWIQTTSDIKNSSVFSKAANFIYCYPVEIFFGVLAVSIICLTAYNYFSLSAVQSLEDRVNTLGGSVENNALHWKEVNEHIFYTKEFMRKNKAPYRRTV